MLGIRPDDLVVDDSQPLMEGKVSVQEPLGAETLINYREKEAWGNEVLALTDGRGRTARRSHLSAR